MRARLTWVPIIRALVSRVDKVLISMVDRVGVGDSIRIMFSRVLPSVL